MKCEMSIVVYILFESVKFRFLDLFFKIRTQIRRTNVYVALFFRIFPTDFWAVPRYPMYVRDPRVGPKRVKPPCLLLSHSPKTTVLEYFITQNHRFFGSLGSMRPQATEPIGPFGGLAHSYPRVSGPQTHPPITLYIECNVKGGVFFCVANYYKYKYLYLFCFVVKLGIVSQFNYGVFRRIGSYGKLNWC